MQHLAKAILTQRDFCADAKSKTIAKERKYCQRTMDSCGLKDVLESCKKGRGWMCGRVETGVLGLSYIFRTRLQETYIVLFPVKLQRVSHLGQLTLQIRHLLLLLQQPDRQHDCSYNPNTRSVIMRHATLLTKSETLGKALLCMTAAGEQGEKQNQVRKGANTG